jgi:hypothetical protein
MTILEVLADPILPVFAILAIGYAAGLREVVSVDDARVANRLVMSIFVPILLFGLMTDAPIREFDPVPVLVYFGAEMLFFGAGVVLARRVFGLSAAEAVLLSFAGIFANTVFYTLPIALFLYGSDGILPFTTVIVLDASITFGGAIIVLQLIALGRVTPLAVLGTIARSPILQAIGLGLLANLSGLSLPHTFVTFIEFNGAAAAPLALFALGVVLSQTRFTFCAPVLTFTAVKVVAFPAAIFLGIWLFAADAPRADQFVMAAAGPAGAMAFSLALLHGVRTDRIAQVIVLSSVLTLVSLAVLA